MKLRIRGNSLRLRLLRGEVEQLGKTGRIAETIYFGAVSAPALTYSLEIDRHAEKIFAAYSSNIIVVKVPEKAARNWIGSGEISLAGEQMIQEDAVKNSSETVLKILIEKDFVCSDRKDDPDNADAFLPPEKCD